MIDIAQRAGAQYDADRESPPEIDDTLYRAIWRVYLATRDARAAAAMAEQIERHRR